jgi:hypothetical protein
MRGTCRGGVKIIRTDAAPIITLVDGEVGAAWRVEVVCRWREIEEGTTLVMATEAVLKHARNARKSPVSSSCSAQARNFETQLITAGCGPNSRSH